MRPRSTLADQQPEVSAPSAREPVAQLHEERRITFDAVLALHQRLPAVHLAAHDADPHAVGRVHGEVRSRRHALEALAAPAVHTNPVVARLLATDAKLEHGA